jgi:hypothetical protein
VVSSPRGDGRQIRPMRNVVQRLAYRRQLAPNKVELVKDGYTDAYKNRCFQIRHEISLI